MLQIFVMYLESFHIFNEGFLVGKDEQNLGEKPTEAT